MLDQLFLGRVNGDIVGLILSRSGRRSGASFGAGASVDAN